MQGTSRTGTARKVLGPGRLWGRMRLQAHTAPSRMLKAVYPWIMDPGLGVPGAYIGSDLMSMASFLFDPFELYAAGVISSPNISLIGEIGCRQVGFDEVGDPAAAGVRDRVLLGAGQTRVRSR